MADFNIQRGTVSFGVADTTVTLTGGGTDYDSPSAITKAFIRIVGHCYCGDGRNSQFGGQADYNMIWISNPENLLTSVQFNRNRSGNELNVQYEIIEYTGTAGGVYEFVVRHQEKLSCGSGTATDDTITVAGVSDANDVVVFITSQGLSSNAGREDHDNGVHTSEYVSGSSVGRVTRASTGGTSECSVAVVEFTGSNWSVSRITHSYSVGQTDEPETISIGAITQAFIHPQIRCTTDGGAKKIGQQVWLNSTTVLYHRVREIDISADAVTWIVEDTSGDMSVQNLSTTRASNTGGNPDTWTDTITAVSALATTSIWGECNEANVTADDGHQAQLGLRLTATTTVTLSRGVNHATRNIRYQAVEWPEAAATGTAIPVFMHHYTKNLG